MVNSYLLTFFLIVVMIVIPIYLLKVRYDKYKLKNTIINDLYEEKQKMI